MMQAISARPTCLLGIMAAVSVLEALLVIGVGVGGLDGIPAGHGLWSTASRSGRSRRAMARVNAILDDVKDVTRDGASRRPIVSIMPFSATIDRVDDTADRVRSQRAREDEPRRRLGARRCASRSRRLLARDGTTPGQRGTVAGGTRVQKAESRNGDRSNVQTEATWLTDTIATSSEGGGGGSFVMGLLTGTVLGAGLGMLFAPKAGSELRSQLSEQAGNLANTASEGYRKASEAASESYKKASGAASEGYKKASEAASEWAGKGREAGREMYDDEAVTRHRGGAAVRARSHAGGQRIRDALGGWRILHVVFGSENIRSSAGEDSSGSTGPSGPRRS